MTLASDLGRGPAGELLYPERQTQHASEQDASDRMLYTFQVCTLQNQSLVVFYVSIREKYFKWPNL